MISYENAEDWGFSQLGERPERKSKEHLRWLRQTATQMSEEYDEVFARLSESHNRIQESGHQIEAAWQKFLVGWLPPQYEVQTRKYIIGEIDTVEPSEETDLVILRPTYPTALRDKHQVLAGGVAAAFSVKSTLRRKSVYEAAASCTRLQNSLIKRNESIRSHVMKPFPYGVLAHSHEWKDRGVQSYESVSKHLFEADQKWAKHPLDSVDMLCVPDLGAWNNIININPMSRMVNPHFAEMTEHERAEYLVAMKSHEMSSSYAYSPGLSQGEVLASFLTNLYSRLAVHDPGLLVLADSFSVMGAGTGGKSKRRSWDADQFLPNGTFDGDFGRWDHFHANRENSIYYGWHNVW